jgi:hypothetical protein
MVSVTDQHNATPTTQPIVEAQAVPGASATEEQDSAAHASKAVEMNNLQTTTGAASSPAEGSSQPQTSQSAGKTSIDQTTRAPDLSRSKTAELALGPDGEPAQITDPSIPALRITLMLTTGARHAYTIWTDWRSEWEDRPRDPSSIRLIIMGRMIDDKVNLKGKNYPENCLRADCF